MLSRLDGPKRRKVCFTYYFISKYIFPYSFCFAPSFGNFYPKIGGSLQIQIQNHQKVSEKEKLISVLDPKTVKSHKQQHQSVVGQILVPARGPSKFAGAGKKRVEKSVSSPVKAHRNLPLDGQHSGRGLLFFFFIQINKMFVQIPRHNRQRQRVAWKFLPKPEFRTIVS